MIDLDRFGDDVHALLDYIPCVAPHVGEQILERTLRDGSWRRAPDRWTQRAWYVGKDNATHGGPSVSELLCRWLSTVAADGTLDSAALGQLADTVTRVEDLGCLEEFISWLTTAASPGDAGVLADVVEHLVDGSSKKALALPVIEWLVVNGGAELRARAVPNHPWGARLIASMLTAVVESEKVQLYEPLIRHLILTENRNGLDQVDVDAAVRAAEQVLGAGASESLATDLVRRLPDWRKPWHVLSDGSSPKVAAALLSGLCDGAFTDEAARGAWTVLCLRPSERISFPSEAVAVKHLGLLAHLRGDGTELLFRSEWMSAAARAFLDLQDDVSGAQGLRPFVRDAQGAIGVARALEDWLPRQSADSKVQLARDVLDSRPPEGRAAYAALALLAGAGRRAGGAVVVEAPLATVRQDLERIVTDGWLAPVAGVDMRRLLGGARRLELSPLPHDAKAVVDGPVLRVDDGFVRFVAAQGYDLRARQLIAIYVLHELVHLAQGIGDYADVGSIRAVGAESTLMHLDLAADHAAVALASRLWPSWQSIELRRVASSELIHFPTSRFHTQAARLRKAYRFVAARIDYLIRRDFARRFVDADVGYHFAEFGLSGTAFLVLRSGPPLTLVCRSTLEQGRISQLFRIVEPGLDPRQRLADLDAVLVDVLKRAEWSVE